MRIALQRIPKIKINFLHAPLRLLLYCMYLHFLRCLICLISDTQSMANVCRHTVNGGLQWPVSAYELAFWWCLVITKSFITLSRIPSAYNCGRSMHQNSQSNKIKWMQVWGYLLLLLLLLLCDLCVQNLIAL